jgi:hypothetical protein
VGDAAQPAPLDEHLAVHVALERQHLGVGAPGDHVLGPGPQVAQLGEGVDGPLDALAPAEQAPGQQHRADRGRQPAAGAGHGRAVGDRGHLGRVDVEQAAEPGAGGLGHHDQAARRVGDLLEHPALVVGGLEQDRVGHHDRRHGQLPQQLDDLLAVGPAEDAVLVLDDGDVVLAEQVGGGVERGRDLVVQLAHHPGIGRAHPIGDTHDTGVAAGLEQAAGQGGGERGQAAGRGRERAQHPVRALGPAHPRGSDVLRCAGDGAPVGAPVRALGALGRGRQGCGGDAHGGAPHCGVGREPASDPGCWQPSCPSEVTLAGVTGRLPVV